MSVVNLREKTINAKIVYYGPPLGGKTTSLKYIHRVMDPERRTNLISLNTERDRTLFFDFLPINIGRIGDFSLKIQGFTVPGQVKYLLTRRYVLRGADAVVFVADSQEKEQAATTSSLRDLKENLRLNGLAYETIPLALQYNKRDEPGVLSIEELDRALNDRAVPRFETVATVGTGVFEAFTAVCIAMVERICAEYRIAGAKEVATSVEATLRKVLESSHRIEAARAKGEAEKAAAGATRKTATPGAPDSPAPEPETAGRKEGPGASTIVVMDDTDDADPLAAVPALLERAVGTTIQVSELLSEVQEARGALEARVGELTALNEVSVAAASVLDMDRVVAAVVEGAARALRTEHASIVLRDEDGDILRERHVQGFLFDPLVSSSRASEVTAPLLAARRPVIVTDEHHPRVLEAMREREDSVLAAVVAPLRIRDQPRGLLTVYYVIHGREPGEAAVRFLGALAASASVAVENARLHGALERFNRELEAKVADRTRELKAAYEELKTLDRLKDDFLSTMSHELMTPLAGIRSSAEILRGYPDMSPEERGGFLDGIESETVRLTYRLQDILDLSALDAGQVEFARDPAVPRELVLEAVNRARPAFEKAGVRLNFWPQPGLPRVPCDARWIGRVLDHLLDNAAKFAPLGSDVDVTVNAEAGDKALRIAVRDRGPGIPPEQRESLFQRFKQLGQVLTDKPPGIGAGLPLTRRVVEGHGGAVGIEGGPGRGTQVWFTLPVE